MNLDVWLQQFVGKTSTNRIAHKQLRFLPTTHTHAFRAFVLTLFAGPISNTLKRCQNISSSYQYIRRGNNDSIYWMMQELALK